MENASAPMPGTTLLGRVPAPLPGATLYARTGDLFGWLCTAAALVLVLTRRFTRRERQPAASRFGLHDAGSL